MGRQKSSSLKKVDLPDDNLDEFFSLSQDKNSQETPDVTPTDLPKKSGDRVERGAKSSNHGNIHRSPQGSGSEGSPEPPSKLKGSPQQVKKPESEDLLSSSSSSSDSQSSDKEKDNRRGRTKTSVPPKQKHTSQSPPHSRRRHSKSPSQSPSPK